MLWLFSLLLLGLAFGQRATLQERVDSAVYNLKFGTIGEQAAALEDLTILAVTPTNHPNIISSGVVPYLANQIKKASKDYTNILSCVRIIGMLSLSIYDSNSAATSGTGILRTQLVDSVLHSLLEYLRTENEEAILVSLQTLGNLAQYEVYQGAVPAIPGAVSDIVLLLGDSYSTEIQKLAAAVLGNLAVLPSNCKSIVCDNAAAGALVKLLEQYRYRDASCVETAVAVLRNLADEGSSEVLSCLVSVGVLPVLQKLRRGECVGGLSEEVLGLAAELLELLLPSDEALHRILHGRDPVKDVNDEL
jgi:hypothetical protein